MAGRGNPWRLRRKGVSRQISWDHHAFARDDESGIGLRLTLAKSNILEKCKKWRLFLYKIGVYGSNGRVGSKICEYLAQDAEAVLSYAFARSSEENSDIRKLFDLSDIVIDFSSKNGLEALLESALTNSTPLVIGTTGFSEEQNHALEQASQKIAILYSPNMSLGINIIGDFLRNYGAALQNYDIDLIETHHRNKKDAPSGTALMLGKAISNNITQEKFTNYHSLRSGDGGFSEHEIVFAHGPERIRIHHQIMNSDIFARNAIMSAKWILDKKKSSGLYSMKDIYMS